MKTKKIENKSDLTKIEEKDRCEACGKIKKNKKITLCDKCKEDYMNSEYR